MSTTKVTDHQKFIKPKTKAGRQPPSPKIKAAPQAPPVYSPQTVPHVLQRKIAVNQLRTGQKEYRPVAPPVYRPQPLPRVLQLKKADNQLQTVPQIKNGPKAPPPYRPQAKPKVLQPRMAAAQRTPAQPFSNLRGGNNSPVIQRAASSSSSSSSNEYQVNILDDGSLKRGITQMIGMGRTDLIAQVEEMIKKEYASESAYLEKKLAIVRDAVAQNTTGIPFIKNAVPHFKPSMQEIRGRDESMCKNFVRTRLLKYAPAPDMVNVKLHKGSREAFQAAEIGTAFTGIVRIYTDSDAAKIFLYPVAPHDSYPTKPHPEGEGTKTRIYEKTFTGLIHHQTGVTASHDQLVEKIDEAKPTKAEHVHIGFTVIKSRPNRYSFTSTSQNASSFQMPRQVPGMFGITSEEEIKSMGRLPTEAWARKIQEVIDGASSS